MKKVLKLFISGSRKKGYVKWVQFLKWHQKLEARNGKKIWREKNMVEGGMNTKQRNFALDF